MPKEVESHYLPFLHFALFQSRSFLDYIKIQEGKRILESVPSRQ